MAVRLRLTRIGGRKNPIWRVVVADQRSKRDGRVIETVGHYNAQTDPSTIVLNEERIRDWLSRGAQPTDTVRRILSYKGVLYLKHLLRGVKLGLFDDAAAMEKFQKWHGEHEIALKKRAEENRKARPGRRGPGGPPMRRVERTERTERTERKSEGGPATTTEA